MEEEEEEGGIARLWSGRLGGARGFGHSSTGISYDGR